MSSRNSRSHISGDFAFLEQDFNPDELEAMINFDDYSLPTRPNPIAQVATDQMATAGGQGAMIDYLPIKSSFPEVLTLDWDTADFLPTSVENTAAPLAFPTPSTGEDDLDISFLPGDSGAPNALSTSSNQTAPSINTVTNTPDNSCTSVTTCGPLLASPPTSDMLLEIPDFQSPVVQNCPLQTSLLNTPFAPPGSTPQASYGHVRDQSTNNLKSSTYPTLAGQRRLGEAATHPQKQLRYPIPTEARAPPPRSIPATAAMAPHRVASTGDVVSYNRGPEKGEPTDSYVPLPSAPKAWGPPENPTLFSYTSDGEWVSPSRFTREDISYYIVNLKRTQHRPLRIWIQNLPAQYAKRYPNTLSSKCRWVGCPSCNNTILKGFYRVAFDEWPLESGKTRDPFHNAGYMHLHCFEKLFDLVELVDIGVADIDMRKFPHEGRNPMSILHKQADMRHVFETWLCRQRGAYRLHLHEVCSGVKGTERRTLDKKDRLWSVLTKASLALEPEARAAMRHRRTGNSLDRHQGDLDKYVEVDERRKAMNRALRCRVKTTNPEDFDMEKQDTEREDETRPPNKRRRVDSGPSGGMARSPIIVASPSQGSYHSETGAPLQTQDEGDEEGELWMLEKANARLGKRKRAPDLIGADGQPWDVELRNPKRRAWMELMGSD